MNRTAAAAARAIAPITMVVALLCISAAPAAKDEPAKVTIKNLKFDPAKITIKAGQTVQWINKDDHDHTVISKTEDFDFDSKNLSSGDTFEHTFPKAGEFPYYCKYHPRMKGTVIVK